VIELAPMSGGDYDAFYQYVIHDYAEGLVHARNAHPDRALQTSVEQHRSVLSNGLDSPGQRFRVIREASLDVYVGCLWWGVVERYGTRKAMLYFVGILAPYRRRGYAMQALRLLEAEVARAGLDELRLYVFGHNAAARALYAKMGYAPSSITMTKAVDV
jgi:ribosomal protein S18 acetylase RimI-like enzyme